MRCMEFSFHRAKSVLFRPSIALVVVWLAAKVMSFARDVVISYYFGASAESDAFFLATSIPNVVYAGLLASVPLVVVPFYTKKRVELASMPRADSAASAVMAYYLALALFFSVLLFFGAEYFVNLIAPTYEGENLLLATNITRIFSLTFFFSMLSALLTSVQLAHGKPIWPQFIPLFSHLIFVVGVIVLVTDYGIYAAATSATLAWFIVAPTQLISVRKYFTLALTFKMERAERLRLMAVFFPVLISVSIESLNPVVAVYFAGGLAEGGVSQLTYALKVVSLFSGVFIALAANITFPRLASSAAAGHVSESQNELFQTFKSVLFFTTLIALVLFIHSDVIVSLIFSRGSFTGTDVLSTSTLVSILAVSLPLVAVREICIRTLHAYSKPYSCMAVGIVSLGIAFTGSYLMVPELELSGIALGLLLSAAAGASLSFFLVLVEIGKQLFVKTAGLVLCLLLSVLVTKYVLGAVGINEQSGGSYLEQFSSIAVITSVYSVVSFVLMRLARFCFKNGF